MTKKTKPTASSATKPAGKETSLPALAPSEAQAVAAAILECLAGLRSPPEAATLLNMGIVG